MTSNLIVELPTGNKQKIELIRKDDLKTIGDLKSKVISPDFKLTTSLTQTYYFTRVGEGYHRNWLNDSVKIDDLNLDDNEYVKIYKRFTLVAVSLALGTQRYFQTLTIDLLAPISQFLMFAAKKFQLEDFEAYALFLDGGLLDPAQSFIDLDILPDGDGELVIGRADQKIEKAKTVIVMEKRGKFLKTNQSKKKKSEDVAVLLMDNVLHIYKDEETPDNHLVSLMLNEHTLEVKEKKKEFAFELANVENPKDIEYFKCENKEELEDWVHFLTPLVFQPEDSVGEKKPPIFGGRLEDAVHPGDELPRLIQDTIEHVRERALQLEGIFRLSGSMTKIEEYIEMYNRGIDVNLDEEEDPHTVAGLLKLYLGKLAEPVFPYDYYDTFIQVQMSSDEVERKRNLRYLIKEFPELNQKILFYLFEFLRQIAEYKDINMMAVHNIATVFAPNLLQPEDKSNPLQMVQDTPLINGLIFQCITDFDYIFSEADPEGSVIAEAQFDYEPLADNQIALTVGDEIRVTQQRDDGWWMGENTNTDVTGLFPASYVKLVPSNMSKKRAFLKKLQQLKNKVAKLDRETQNLQNQKTKLLEDIDILSNQSRGNEQLSEQLHVVIGANKKLKDFGGKLEGYYTKLETQTQYRTALTIKKQELLMSLQELKKQINTDKKLKKQKDKIDLIDGLREIFEEEQKCRSSADEAKDRILKDFIELKKILN